MSFFEGQLNPAWTPQHRQQQSWDQSSAPSRSGATSAASQREDSAAFGHQFEEIARAQDILAKSQRSFPQGGHGGGSGHGRRESLPQMAGGQFSRQFDSFERSGPPQRHHSVSEYDARSPSSASSSSYQGFIANQRFGPRPSEAEQMLQAKRRAAAQRERELRNYHQEQQYNRNSTSSKGERAMSPGAMSEEDRRELIQRQHRALYGDTSNLYIGGEGGAPRPGSQDARVLTSHNSSPLGYDSFGMSSASSGAEGVALPATAGGPPRDGTNSSSPPTATNSRGFGGFDPAQGNAATGNSPPGSASPTRAGVKGPPGAGVAPIGTRPLVAQGKRGTPPMPSPLSFGAQGSTERSQSSASNPTQTLPEKGSNLGWGGNSGPWGNKPQSVWS